MTLSIKLGVGTLILNSEKKILLGYRTVKPAENTWSPTGGHLEFGETFEECAIREVKEETNLDIESPTFITTTNHILSPQYQFVLIHMQAYYSGAQQIINKEPHKAREWQWFSYTNLPENLTPSLIYIQQKGFLKNVMECQAPGSGSKSLLL